MINRETEPKKKKNYLDCSTEDQERYQKQRKLVKENEVRLRRSNIHISSRFGRLKSVQDTETVSEQTTKVSRITA